MDFHGIPWKLYELASFVTFFFFRTVDHRYSSTFWLALLADHRYLSPFRLASLADQKYSSLFSARFVRRVSTIHHCFGSLRSPNHRYSSPFRLASLADWKYSSPFRLASLADRRCSSPFRPVCWLIRHVFNCHVSCLTHLVSSYLPSWRLVSFADR